MTQVIRFIKNEKLTRAILITTTNLKNNYTSPYNKIQIMDYSSLSTLFSQNYSSELDYIRNYSVNRENNNKKIKRQQILDFVESTYNRTGQTLKSTEITNELHLDLRTYFNSLFDIYKQLKIPIHAKKMRGLRSKNPDFELIELWETEFKNYILEIYKKEKRYPSGIEIGKIFGISHI